MSDVFSSSDQALPERPRELLTRQFYDWELRGRGWQVWPYPVDLEPPFRPFLGHYTSSLAAVDDGQRPSLLGSLSDEIKKLLVRTSRPIAATLSIAESEWEEPLPKLFSEIDPIIELRILLPPGFVVRREAMEQFLLSLKFCRFPLCFELIGLPSSIFSQIAVRQSDLSHVVQQFRAYFPDVAVETTENSLVDLWDEDDSGQRQVVDFGLSNEFMLPVRTFPGFEFDPFVGVVGALTDIRDEELGLLQVVFQPAREPWAESMLRAVTDSQGKPFFADAPQMVPYTKQKVSRPLFSVVIRAAARGSSRERSLEVVRAIGSALVQFTEPGSNGLIPLENTDYPVDSHLKDIANRQSRRSGMILNSAELLGFVHLPSASVRAEKLKREVKRSKAAPILAAGHDLILGENVHIGKKMQVSLAPEHRLSHTYVIGASGTGKSTLLLNLIKQDIERGEGVGVLDPHGDLIDRVIEFIPRERFEDVVLFDPADEEYPIGFNILSAHSELEKNLLSSDLVAGFRRLSTSWGDQMTSVLGNAVLAFLESEKGGSLAELRRFLVEEGFRREFLDSVKDPEVVYYWQSEFPLLSGKPQAPLLTRLDTFLRPKLIRYMISQKENRLDFRKIMDEKKIFLARLAQGVIGEENSHLLGTLIVSKIHQMVMGRQEVSEAERRNFFLYIDEFHNFVTASMASILSGARKYHLGLILAHQELRQLWNKDTDVASSVISNPYTRVCFRLGDFDAQKLKDGFSFFEAKDLQNLGTGEAIARIERAEYDFNLRTFPLPRLDDEVAKERRDRLIAISREKYARKREEVEADLEQTRSSLQAQVRVPVEKKAKRSRKTVEEPVEPVTEQVVAEPVTRQRRKSISTPHSLPGRGGQHHKYMQQLVKKLAEAKGYKAVIEKKILDGAGSVDVSLERENTKLACEISVTTSAEQELGNVQKCLAAGYDQVILLSPEKKTLNKLQKLVSSQLEAENLKKVLFLQTEEVVAFLEELEAEGASKVQTVRGYKVKTRYKPIGEKEKETRRQAVWEVLKNSVRGIKRNK